MTNLSSASNQTGAVLLISLVILLIMTIVGASALVITTTDTKIIANSRDNQVAFHRAETALTLGENLLESMLSPAAWDSFPRNAGTFADAELALHRSAYLDQLREGGFENRDGAIDGQAVDAGSIWARLLSAWDETACQVQDGDLSQCSVAGTALDTYDLSYAYEYLGERPIPCESLSANCIPESAEVFQLTAKGIGEGGITRYLQSLYVKQTDLNPQQ